jgi:hypothetical protein
MTEAEKIQIAADIIYSETRRAGGFINHDTALGAARQIHAIWCRQSMLHATAPGEIAQKCRERYESGDPIGTYRADDARD